MGKEKLNPNQPLLIPLTEGDKGRFTKPEWVEKFSNKPKKTTQSVVPPAKDPEKQPLLFDSDKAGTLYSYLDSKDPSKHTKVEEQTANKIPAPTVNTLLNPANERANFVAFKDPKVIWDLQEEDREEGRSRHISRFRR